MKPEYRIGTASWTDPTLLAAGFYPPKAKTAEARLRFYAAHFDTVEVDSTYYALPNERNAALWVARTPDDFQFNVKAFALLTQHAAATQALPPAIKHLLSEERLREPQLRQVPPDVLHLSFEMFRRALAPLREAAKLGCVLFQFPPWFTAHESNEQYIDFCRQQMPGFQLAIEFRHASWLNGRTQQTLDFLSDRGLSLVCFDAPQAATIPRTPFIATCEVAYVRFHGRNRQTWFRPQASAAERFKYSYSDADLREQAAKIRHIGGARVVYVLFNNCYGDYGVRNATTMQQLLSTPP